MPVFVSLAKFSEGLAAVPLTKLIAVPPAIVVLAFKRFVPSQIRVACPEAGTVAVAPPDIPVDTVKVKMPAEHWLLITYRLTIGGTMIVTLPVKVPL